MENTPTLSHWTTLPEEARAQLIDWLLEGLPWYHILLRLERDFGLSLATTELKTFWQECGVPQVLQRRAHIAALARTLTEEAQRQPGPTHEALSLALQQRAFAAAMAPNAKLADLKILFELVFAACALQFQNQKLELDRRKVALLETHPPASGNPAVKARDPIHLTDEERQLILKEIDAMFGL